MRIKSLFLIVSVFLISNSAVSAVSIIPSPPTVDAKSYLLMDHDSQQLLVSQEIDMKLPPASLTKIMTVYVAAYELAQGNISLDDEAVISEKAWKMPGSRMFIEVNDKVTVRDLLRGIIIQSGNDASVAIAEHVSGDEAIFAQLMNQHAKRLGMKNSHFTNATGLPHDNHYTTARDVAILASALIRDFPEIYAIHAEKQFSYNDIKQNNRNRLLWLDESVDGIKTGHTEEAGYCLVTSAMRENMRLISVVFGSSDDNARTKANQVLLNYGFRFFETTKIYSRNENIYTADIWKGQSDNIHLGLNKDLYVTIPRGQADKLDTVFEVPEFIIAPVEQGSNLGHMSLILDDKKIVDKPLIAIQTVTEGGFFKRIKDELHLMIVR